MKFETSLCIASIALVAILGIGFRLPSHIVILATLIANVGVRLIKSAMGGSIDG